MTGKLSSVTKLIDNKKNYYVVINKNAKDIMHFKKGARRIIQLLMHT